MHTLIQAAEIWVPDADGYLLEFGDGTYGDAIEFDTTSRALCFGRGEGLPGRVWEDGRPMLLADLAHGRFRRAKAAANAGYLAAVGLPYFASDEVAAIVVLFFGDVAAAHGAVELWQVDGATRTSIARIGSSTAGPDDTRDRSHLSLPIGERFALSLAGHASLPIALGVASRADAPTDTPRLERREGGPSTLTLPVGAVGAVAIDL